MYSSLQLSVHTEKWAVKTPFRIANHCWDVYEGVIVELTDGKHYGRGEGLGVYYLNETVDSMQKEIEAVTEQIECGIDREALLELMPAGGARNAVDCALWDLVVKQSETTIWELTGIKPGPVTTVFTIGIEDTTEAMVAKAKDASNHPLLKIKLDEHQPVERISAIRAARPDARLVVDANQGWSFEQLQDISPKLAEMGVEMIEQPLPRDGDEVLESYISPIPLSADESCLHREELERASRCYQIINIKLDKTGGLTEALLLAREAQNKRLDLMVGSMGGTSLSMAPSFVIAQICSYADLDGPLLLKHDRFPRMKYDAGKVMSPEIGLWG